MTHFAGVVLVPVTKLMRRGGGSGEGAAFDAVADLVHQYCEDEEWGEDGTRYDWFTIGGRFTGALDGYEPWNDTRNFEPCEWCEATGITTQAVADKYPAYQANVGKPCIQCAVDHKGEPKPRAGEKLKWHYEPHDGDIVPVAALDFDRMRYVPSVLVTPDGEWYEQGRHGMFASIIPNEKGEEAKDEDEWKREFSRLVNENRAAVAVLVDFHV